MVCTTRKEGVECFFMSKKGCGFNGGNCHPVVEQCETCQKAREFPTGKYCLVFPDPTIKWRAGTCNMATHATISNGKTHEKLNPLKASKRASR